MGGRNGLIEDFAPCRWRQCRQMRRKRGKLDAVPDVIAFVTGIGGVGGNGVAGTGAGLGLGGLLIWAGARGGLHGHVLRAASDALEPIRIAVMAARIVPARIGKQFSPVLRDRGIHAAGVALPAPIAGRIVRGVIGVVRALERALNVLLHHGTELRIVERGWIVPGVVSAFARGARLLRKGRAHHGGAVHHAFDDCPVAGRVVVFPGRNRHYLLAERGVIGKLLGKPGSRGRERIRLGLSGLAAGL